MAFQIFSIEIPNDGKKEDEMNRFLARHPVVAVRSQWVSRGEVPYQVFTVEYVPDKPAQSGLTTPPSSEANSQVDYKKILSPEAFVRYCKLRDARKKIADREAVKAFVVFTNAQLAAIAQQENPVVADLKKIEGVGDSRVEKYGAQILSLAAEETDA